MKIDSYLEKYEFARRFEVLRLNQFLEILQSSKTPNKFWIDQLKITIKVSKFCAQGI